MAGVPSGCLPQLWLRFRLSLVPCSLFNTPDLGIITVACGLPFVYMLGKGLSPVSITLPICCKNFWVQEVIPCCWTCIDHSLSDWVPFSCYHCHRRCHYHHGHRCCRLRTGLKSVAG